MKHSFPNFSKFLIQFLNENHKSYNFKAKVIQFLPPRAKYASEDQEYNKYSRLQDAGRRCSFMYFIRQACKQHTRFSKPVSLTL